ncbi:AAA family ATPase [uncultured Gimesia sp.]|uniref:AAA family ATPase n=1 Tax=uncultured Gimesia sp. TaxID=1678688 RepID=UPI00262A6AD8|nr:AAA family ATPase [uncultured Gimesia sp.]
MKKINVIGTSGSGKSTFAKKLSKKLGYPYIEMDAIFWGKDWFWPSDDEFFKNLEQRLSVDQWVLDGNYTRTVSIKWKEVDTIIWIDYSLHRTLYQALKRAIVRSCTREELWPGTGNRESFRKLLSKDSILLWTIKTYHKNKKKYSKLAENPEYREINIVRLRSPKECQKYLSETGT